MAGITKIGFELKCARRALGYQLDQPATELCIQKKYLKALENNNFSAFPSLAYAIGFLRSYADYLSLPAEPLVECLKSAVAPLPAATPSVPSIGRKCNRWLPIASFAASLGVVVSALYMGWQAVSGAPDRASMVPDLPSHLAALLAEEPSKKVVIPAALLADGTDGYFNTLLPEKAEKVRILAISDVPIVIMDSKGMIIGAGVFYSGESFELAKKSDFTVITPDLSALTFFIADAPSSVTAAKTDGLFHITIEMLQSGVSDPIPAS